MTGAFYLFFCYLFFAEVVMMKQFVLILYFLFSGSGVMPVLPLCAEEEPSDSSSQYEYVEY